MRNENCAFFYEKLMTISMKDFLLAARLQLTLNFAELTEIVKKRDARDSRC